MPLSLSSMICTQLDNILDAHKGDVGLEYHVRPYSTYSVDVCLLKQGSVLGMPIYYGIRTYNVYTGSLKVTSAVVDEIQSYLDNPKNHPTTPMSKFFKTTRIKR